MSEKINIFCKNNNQEKSYSFGTSLFEIKKDIIPDSEYPFLGALVNNKLCSIDTKICSPANVEFIDATNADGRRILFQSFIFVLYSTLLELYPKTKLHVRHSVSNGTYCELENFPTIINDEAISKIKAHIDANISKNLKFVQTKLPTLEAVTILESVGLDEKAEYIRERDDLYSTIYWLGETPNAFYCPLVRSTKLIETYSIEPFYDGILVKIADKKNPKTVPVAISQPKMFNVFREHKKWGKIMEIESVSQLNKQTINNESSRIIKLTEALQERKVVEIANEIANRKGDVKIILIAGPSSSGKTTFCKRLSVQLRVAGIAPLPLSLDDYFVNREDTPLDKDGKYNFESIEAIDIELFNKDLLKLMNGEAVEIPSFDFKDGVRLYNGEWTKISPNHVIVIEGIHGLNPLLTPHIKPHLKFGIFTSALTQLSLDYQDYIHTTDNRLLRRIIRDFQYRHYSAEDTIGRWESVRRGEEKNIFPYQENADMMFNSALVYELGVLKNLAVPILQKVQEAKPEYREAQRLLSLLSHIKTIPEKEVPPTSILREFLSWSSFSY